MYNNKHQNKKPYSRPTNAKPSSGFAGVTSALQNNYIATNSGNNKNKQNNVSKGNTSNFRGGNRKFWYTNSSVKRPQHEKPIAYSISPKTINANQSKVASAPSNDNENIPIVNINETTAINPHQLIQPLISYAIESALSTPSMKYSSWKNYFPTEEFHFTSKTYKHIQAVENHIIRRANQYDLHKIKDTLWYTLDLKLLLNDQKFKDQWSQFQQDLNQQPEHTINCAGIAMHQLILNHNSAVDSKPLSLNYNSVEHLKIVRARIKNHQPIVSVKSLKVNNFGQFISVRGTIIRASASQILCVWLVFRCQNCRHEQVVRQIDGIMVLPRSCGQQKCKNRTNFQPLLDSTFTQTVNFQTIRLQDTRKGMCTDLGNVPRSIDIELIEDLVDSVYPGDDVTVTGILKVRPQEESSGGGGGSHSNYAHASIYKMYIQGMAIISNKNILTDQNEFTNIDLEIIDVIRIGTKSNPFRLLTNSLCPQIYGHEMAKAGLLLALFGGAENKENRRSESHILIVGDPGIGKSQMLQACASASPKGMFVCGNSSTSIGLTACIRQNKGNSGTMEAGALVLCDQGVCCIDEFDKMTSNHSALLEVMEQQTVSVAKAGALCSLPARTAILTAANPNGGHYDKSRTVSENIRVGPALLSRFDLVFIVLDRPDVRLDSLLTAHINSTHSTSTKSSSSSTQSRFTFSNVLSNTSVHTPVPLSQSTQLLSCDADGRSRKFEFNSNGFDNGGVGDADCYQSKENCNLREFLKLQLNENVELLPHVIMQKYIDYARKNIQPVLSRDASDELKRFYLELRMVKPGLDTIPVTVRQLEALIRLTQARARIDLCTEATREHALNIIEIYQYSLVDVFSTDRGTLQIGRNINGSGMSQANRAKKLLEILKSRLINNTEKTVFHYDEIKNIAIQYGIQKDFDQLLDSINIQGFVLKCGQNYYKLVN